MPVPHHSVFTGRMPFLPPNQQRQNTEGKLPLIRAWRRNNSCWTGDKLAVMKLSQNETQKFETEPRQSIQAPRQNHDNQDERCLETRRMPQDCNSTAVTYRWSCLIKSTHCNLEAGTFLLQQILQTTSNSIYSLNSTDNAKSWFHIQRGNLSVTLVPLINLLQ